MSADNVVPFRGVTRLNLPTDRVLETAKEAVDEHVMVLGWDKDGSLYFSSSVASGPECLWLLECAKAALLSMGED